MGMDTPFYGMTDYISRIIKDKICTNVKSIKYRDVKFKVTHVPEEHLYSIDFYYEPICFIHHGVYSYDTMACIGDIYLHSIVLDMYNALEKVAKSNGKNAASYFIDENPRNDALDTIQYFYKMAQYYKKAKEKENNKMENRITSTVKTEAEVNYDNTISEIDQHQAADYDKIRKEADAARLAAKQELEIQKLREEKKRIALDYRFFYEELIAAGFSEEEAWKILLNKQPGYMAPPYYSFSDI